MRGEATFACDSWPLEFPLASPKVRGERGNHRYHRGQSALEGTWRCPLISTLYRHAHEWRPSTDRSRAQPYGEDACAVFQLGDPRVGVMRVPPFGVAAFFGRWRSSRARSPRVGVSIPEACARGVRNS